jgi:hypothetical protein
MPTAWRVTFCVTAMVLVLGWAPPISRTFALGPSVCWAGDPDGSGNGRSNDLLFVDDAPADYVGWIARNPSESPTGGTQIQQAAAPTPKVSGRGRIAPPGWRVCVRVWLRAFLSRSG